MVSFRARAVRKIFSAPETAFAVWRVSVSGRKQGRIIIGPLAEVREGDLLDIEGEEVEHPRFGSQVRVVSYQHILPDDSEGMIRYLSSGRFHGIGRKTAEKIVAHFGMETFSILEHAPERLHEVRGLRATVSEEMRQQFAQSRALRSLTVKLAPHGIGSETISKILRQFGVAAEVITEANPYLFMGRIPGIGFKTADAMARAYGIAATDSQRIAAGILHLLDQMESQSGDLCLNKNDLLSRSQHLLGIEPAAIAVELQKLAERLVVHIEPGEEHLVAKSISYQMEKAVAQNLRERCRRNSSPPPAPLPLEQVSPRLAADLTEEQKLAVHTALSNPVTIITGGPGTGKTTLIRALIDVLRAQKKKLHLAAPTGRAAKRIEESSHYPALTLHRLLQINPETGQFVYNRGNPLKSDALIIDEFSMVDIFLFYSLLQALFLDTRLILIGDRDQLPSVGPGNILRDLIGSGQYPTICLTRNFRQQADSLIVENAHRVNRGSSLQLPPYSPQSDFVLVPVDDAAAAEEKILRLVRYFQGEYPCHSPQFQILSPMYRGPAGIDRLNQRIQEMFNEEPVLWQTDKITFKRRDKVMQLKNNYDKEVYNGDLGLVSGYDQERQVLTVEFEGRAVEYSIEELDEITLAYAVSVHKAQGSEYEVVVLCLLPVHARLLYRELLYTAITRARQRLIMVSNERAINMAVSRNSPRLRRTLLPSLLAKDTSPAAT